MHKSNPKGIFDIINGIRNVGLSELSEVGLSENEYFVIPDVLVANFILEAIEESKVATVYAKCKTQKDVIEAKLPLNLSYDGENLVTAKGEKIKYDPAPISEKDQDRALSTIVEHFKALPEPIKTIKTCCNVICLASGWIQNNAKSESKIIKTVDNVVDKDAIANLKKILEKDLPALQGLCVAATINHWMTNHSLGGNLRNSILERSYAFLSIASTYPLKGKALKEAIYTIVHAVDKRNCLFSIANGIPGLSGTITLGLPVPCEFSADKSIKLRINGIPAGNRRIEIALALFRFAYENDLLAASKSISYFDDIVALKDTALEIGVSAHIGAKFYTYGSADPKVYKDLVNFKVNEVISDYGNIITAIAPESSLAMSPIVINQVAANPRKPVVERAKALLVEVSKAAEDFAKSIQEEYLKDKYAVKDAASLLKKVEKYMVTNVDTEIFTKTKEELKV